MTGRKIISLFLIFLILVPAPVWGQLAPSRDLSPAPGPGQAPAQGWGQSTPGRDLSPDEQKILEEQAQGYLQRIPAGPITGQLPQQLRPPSTRLPESAKILTTAPRQPEETSAAERRAAEYGLAVKQYGYSFFYKPPETFLPVQSVPVGPDYVIGPGDTIKILVWGSVQGEYSLTVDNNGQIAIPKVGVVHVSGLTFRQLREVMDREFSRQFTNFQMNVTLDNLRTIQVYVVGQARFPGSYAVSSLSTLISALFAAGGPSKSGSMRDIQVRRGSKVVIVISTCMTSCSGEIRARISGCSLRMSSLSHPLVLWLPSARRVEKRGGGSRKGQSRETVVVEAEAPAVGGPVKVPGIFELKNERSLTDLLTLGGGLADTAFKGRVQVLRVKQHREMVLFEDDLDKVLLCEAPNISLVDGDFVKIFRVPEVVEKTVKLAGAVKKPGDFGIHDRMRVKDLIDYAGGLLMEANQQEAEITRVTITPDGPVTSRVYINLRQALNGSPRENILLRPNDYVFIRTVPDWALYRLAKIEGEVKYPGNYAIKKGETLSSLISRAGGYTDNAYSKGAFFTRTAVQKMQAEHLKVVIDKLEAEMIINFRSATQAALDKEDVEAAKNYRCTATAIPGQNAIDSTSGTGGPPDR